MSLYFHKFRFARTADARMWIAWVPDDPFHRFTGRTHFEAVGKLLVFHHQAVNIALDGYSTEGRRIVPTPFGANPVEDCLKLPSEAESMLFIDMRRAARAVGRTA